MQIEQHLWTGSDAWVPQFSNGNAAAAQLAFVFGARERLQRAELIEVLRTRFPHAYVFGCSTAGEICDTRVHDDSVVVTAVHFEHSQVRAAETNASSAAASFETGAELGRALPHTIGNDGQQPVEPLRHVLVLSDGLRVNGSELLRGLMSCLPQGIAATGGLAADGARFGETSVFRDSVPTTGAVAAVGLYGSRLQVGIGSRAGWDAFGPERIITRSQGNVLLELDGRPALALYKQYLGEHAEGLPATGLLFPLSVRMNANDRAVVRTILAVDEERQSMTFAGDVPEGAYAHLSKASFERLVDGAVAAAQTSRESSGPVPPQLAILISCVGRKLVLKQRVEEEVEGVREVLGPQAALTGFYSYGEIAPFARGARCELHNQTMTITTLAEA
jgi:hypothetical protein